MADGAVSVLRDGGDAVLRRERVAIHYPYAHSGAAFDLRPYAIRRVFRIYPPRVVAVIVTLIAEQVALPLAHLPPSTWGKTVATIAMAQNYAAPAGQMAGNPSLWLLPVEMELYAAYPLLLWIWRRAGTSRMLMPGGLCQSCPPPHMAQS